MSESGPGSGPGPGPYISGSEIGRKLARLRHWLIRNTKFLRKYIGGRS